MPKPADLETAFTAALCAALEQAEGCGVRQPRLREQATKYGGVPCAKDMIRRRRQSDGFEALGQAGRLDLSLEALVTAAKFGPVFTDDEVNACFQALCDAGYYVF